MNWLQRTAQVNNLQQILTDVAMTRGDIVSAEQYLAGMAPAPDDVCMMINTVARTYPGAQASMGRLARAAGCQFDPSMDGENENMMPGMNMPALPPAENSMEIPSIEID